MKIVFDNENGEKRNLTWGQLIDLIESNKVDLNDNVSIYHDDEFCPIQFAGIVEGDDDSLAGGILEDKAFVLSVNELED